MQTILTEGETEEGHYYNYEGNKMTQKNEGIQWLTDFSSFTYHSNGTPQPPTTPSNRPKNRPAAAVLMGMGVFQL